MRVFTGSYVGNGVGRGVDIGANKNCKPRAIWVLQDAAQAAGLHTPTMWCGRSNFFGAVDSANDACKLTDRGFVVGNNAAWNTNGVTHHYVAFCETDDCGFDVTSYMGNATNGFSIKTQQQKQIVAAVFKRDSLLSGILAVAGAPAASATSALSGTWVNSLGVGQASITQENEVNQLDGPGGLGEEVALLAFYSASNVATFSYVGDGTANRVLYSSSFPIKAAIVYRTTVGGGSARLKTDTMAAGFSKPANAAAFQANEMNISGSTVTTGSVLSLNVNGVSYSAILIGDTQKTLRTAPVIKVRGQRGIQLNTTTSYIDCGVADGALMINGAITVEAACVMFCQATADNIETPLILRGNGGYGAANGYSWGIDAFRSADGAFAWPGPQFHIVVAERLDNAVDIRKEWRTGICIPSGRLFHVLVAHDGLGGWKLYLNGDLVKQRSINLAALTGGVFPLPNIQSVSGHRTVIGARGGAGPTFTTTNRAMIHRVARVYNVELTADEARTRAEKVLYGATADVTRGMAEEWDAANASSTILPATVSSANNGTINNGIPLVF